MDNELSIPEFSNDMIPGGHAGMLKEIEEAMPVIQADKTAFGKRQSAFMDNMLTVSQPTPLRKSRQILSELERATGALKEAHFRREKLKIQLEIYQEKSTQHNGAESKLWALKAQKAASDLESGKLHIAGAIRKVHQYIKQYKSILEKAGKTNFTEEDFEKEEEEYHIKTAFTQALCAARSNGGKIDEGNHIYLFQIGINGAAAQADINALLEAEAKFLNEQKAPPHELIIKWLDDVYKRHKGSAIRYAEIKGLEGTYHSDALVDKSEATLHIAKYESK